MMHYYINFFNKINLRGIKKTRRANRGRAARGGPSGYAAGMKPGLPLRAIMAIGVPFEWLPVAVATAFR